MRPTSPLACLLLALALPACAGRSAPLVTDAPPPATLQVERVADPAYDYRVSFVKTDALDWDPDVPEQRAARALAAVPPQCAAPRIARETVTNEGVPPLFGRRYTLYVACGR